MTTAPKLIREQLLALAERFPELNLCNYDGHDVENINAWGIEVTNLLRSLAAEPVGVQVRLFDSQWVNIVNHNNSWRGFDASIAVHEAVKMAEDAIANNVASGTLPQSRAFSIAQPDSAEGEQPKAEGDVLSIDAWKTCTCAGGIATNPNHHDLRCPARKLTAAATQPPAVGEDGDWTDDQIIEFMSVALRHTEYAKGTSGPTITEIRQGLKRIAALSAAPQPEQNGVLFCPCCGANPDETQPEQTCPRCEYSPERCECAQPEQPARDGVDDPPLPWRTINELPQTDDLFWFMRGDTVDGPRAPQARGYDADEWDWFAPCTWPSTSTKQPPQQADGVDEVWLRELDPGTENACWVVGNKSDEDSVCFVPYDTHSAHQATSEGVMRAEQSRRTASDESNRTADAFIAEQQADGGLELVAGAFNYLGDFPAIDEAWVTNWRNRAEAFLSQQADGGAVAEACKIGDYGALNKREWATVIYDDMKIAECYTNEDAEFVAAALNGRPPKSPGVGDEMVERVAEAIYMVMPYDQKTGTKPDWVPRGNSDKQSECRRRARAALGGEK